MSVFDTYQSSLPCTPGYVIRYSAIRSDVTSQLKAPVNSTCSRTRLDFKPKSSATTFYNLKLRDAFQAFLHCRWCDGAKLANYLVPHSETSFSCCNSKDLHPEKISVPSFCSRDRSTYIIVPVTGFHLTEFPLNFTPKTQTAGCSTTLVFWKPRIRLPPH